MSDLAKRLAALTPAQRQALLARLRQPAPPESQAPAAIRREPADAYPASVAQERMWFLHQLEAEQRSYSGSTGLRLSGHLDRAALARAVATMADRHEVLRSTFEERDGRLMQVPHPGMVALEVVDLSSVSDEVRDAEARTRIEQRRDEPLDLARGPLFRATLYALSDDAHILLLSAHHIVADGTSIELLSKELSTLYAAFAAGRPSPLPPPGLQYGDYARWEREAPQVAARTEGLAYWTRTLAGLDPLALTADRAGTGERIAAVERLTLSPATTAAIKATATDLRSTLFMTLLAAFAAVLHRQTGQRDIPVGTPLANRARPETEALVGLFVNLLALRVPVTADETLRDLVERTSRVCLDGFQHQHVPFGAVVEAVSPEREAGQNPIVQVLFALQTASFHLLELPGIAITPYDVEEAKTRFAIEVHAWDRGRDIEVEALYQAGLYDRDTVAGLLARFARVVDTLAAAPGTRVGDVALASAVELRAVAEAGCGPAGPDPIGPSLGQRLLAMSAARGGDIALEDGQTRWSYAELGARARRLGGGLRALGVDRNVVVAIWQERGAELWATAAGIAVAGGAYLPVEPNQPAARAEVVLRAAATHLVVTTPALAGRVPSGPWRVVTVETLETLAEPLADAPGTSADLGCVLFTSGSTGTPKAVAIPQAAIVRLVVGTNYLSLAPSIVMGQTATPAFDAAAFEVWGAWLHGARLVVIPTAVIVSPAALGAYTRGAGVTTLFLTTALMHQVGREAPGALAGLETLVFGGETAEPKWVAAIQAAGAPRQMINVYGPTENTTFSTTALVGPVTLDGSPITIGQPVAQSSCWVEDAAGTLAPVGVPGELLVGGAGLAWGYLGNPRLTAERFVPDAYSGAAGARLYRTGDIVRWTAPGELRFVGRRDGQVKLRGHRIELGEVEVALRAVTGVAEGVVVVTGTGLDRRLVAYVAPAPGATLTAASVRAAVGAQLPRYMVPASVVVLPVLPLNTNGKVERRALPAPAAVEEPAVADGTPVTGAAVPPSALKRTIARVWSEVLGVTPVGEHDNFFDLGGHSLLLVRVQSALEAAIGRSVSFVTLFQYPTVAALAAHLGDDVTAAPEPGEATAAGTGSGPVAIIGYAGRFPGAPSVEALWAAVREGRELLRRFTDDEPAAMRVSTTVSGEARFVPVHGALADPDLFDADLFGYTPREATLLDPQQRVLLECAWAALEHAGYGPQTRRAERIGVWAGTSHNSYYDAAHQSIARVSPLERVIAGDKDFLATRVGYKLDLGGPAVTVQTACSTSLVAVHLASQALRAGECEVALAGGVSITVPAAGYVYQPEGIASPDGHCRPFDAAAAGTVAGNGVGVVVLKPLARARADGDTIHAVLAGSAINNDGADKVGFTAPSVHGQAAVVRAAQAAAGLTPAQIGYVEAHGTGTALGDPIEVAALRQVWGDAPGPVGLSSVKGSVGHLDAAAGVTGLLTAIQAVRTGEIPATAHFTRPNPQLDLGPFTVANAPRPWPTPGVRRAGVSSFGMGGTNAHVVLEQAPDAADGPAAAVDARVAPGTLTADGPQASDHADVAAGGALGAWQVVPVSGQSAAAVAAAAAHLAAWLDAASLDAVPATTPAHAPPAPASDVTLADVAWTQQVGRAALPVRRVAVGRAAATVAAALRTAPDHVVRTTPPVVWMCPGQGTALLHAGAALYRQPASAFRAELDACAHAVHPLLGADLRAVLYPRAADTAWATSQLATTLWTQVGLVAVGLALAAQWRAWGVRPAAVVGHSVGEITAAALAGVLTRADALRLAAARGQAMGAAPSGGMLAVLADEATTRTLLGDDLWLAAVNRPTQCVVAGAEAALVRAEAACAARGLATQRLATAGAFHSGLMAGAVAPIAAAAAALPHQAPQVPWVSAVSGAVASAESTYWAEQVVAPVRWVQALTATAALVEVPAVWMELGPGHTLTHLAQGTVDAAAIVASLDAPAADEAMARAIGALWTAGVPLDWSAVHAPARPRRRPLPGYPFQRQRYWLALDAQDATGTAALAKRDDIGRWFYSAQWMREPLIARDPEDASAGRSRHPLVFVDDARGVALVAALEEAGAAPVRVDADANFRILGPRHYAVDPRRAEDLRLLAAHAWPPDGPRHAVVAWRTADDNDRGLADTWHLAATLATDAGAQSLRLVLVTRGTCDVTGAETLAPGASPVLGLGRVLAQEHPRTQVTVADVADEESDAAAARAVLAELGAAEPPAPLVAYRSGLRWTEHFTSRPLGAPAGTPRLLRRRGVYVITGGLGRVGLVVAQYLADAVAARLVLVGRAGELAPDVRDRLVSAGAEVVPVAADVADADRLAQVLAFTEERFGTIDGVVHAAGVTSGPTFAPIVDLRWPDVAAQLRPKRDGARALQAALGSRRPDFCVLTSSLSTVLGGAGFGAYAAANAFLGAFAAERTRTTGVPWIAVDFDGWRFDEEAHAGETGRLAMTPAEGAAVLARLFDAAPMPRVVVSTADLGERRRRWSGEPDVREPAHASAPVVAAASRAHRGDAEYVAPAGSTETRLAALWAECFGFDQIGARDDFFVLGGHSLLGTQLMSRVRDTFAVDLALAALFAAPTIAALAAKIDARVEEQARRRREQAALLDRVKAMSPEERAQLLQDARRAREGAE